MSGQVQKYGIVLNLEVGNIDDSSFQIRVDYGDIEGLADDIKRRGLLVPILVRPRGDRYELVHGHRRLSAIKTLEQKYIFAVVRELEDQEALLIQGSENLKRRNYSAIEEAKYYKKCLEYGVSIKNIATEGKRDQSHINRYLDFLDLPLEIQEKIHRGDLSVSKARELTKLTKVSPSMPVGTDKGIKEFQEWPRTEEYFEEIRILSNESDLKDYKAMSLAVEEIKDGKPLNEAITIAKSDYDKRKTKERASTSAPEPQEMAIKIINNLPDPHEIDNKILNQYPRLVRELLSKGLLKCPYCGESHLVWKCNGKEI